MKVVVWWSGCVVVTVSVVCGWLMERVATVIVVCVCQRKMAEMENFTQIILIRTVLGNTLRTASCPHSRGRSFESPFPLNEKNKLSKRQRRGDIALRSRPQTTVEDFCDSKDVFSERLFQWG